MIVIDHYMACICLAQVFRAWEVHGNELVKSVIVDN